MLLYIVLLFIHASQAALLLSAPGHLVSESTTELLPLNLTLSGDSNNTLIAIRVTWNEDVSGSVGSLPGSSVNWLVCAPNEFDCNQILFYTHSKSAIDNQLSLLRFKRNSALTNATQVICVQAYQNFDVSQTRLSVGTSVVTIPIITSRLSSSATIGPLYYAMIGISAASWLCIVFGCYISCNQIRSVYSVSRNKDSKKQ